MDTLILNNRYRLERPLGTGGMATVYRAHDRMLERTVAVKTLRDDLSKDPAFRERFHQEAKAAANLTHPNIVTVHDFGWDAATGWLFIVMEYVPGTDLKTMLLQRGRFTVDEALPLMVQACAGLGYAHRAGLVHCDVKPQNMIITPDRRLKVADFGIARALASIRPDERTNLVWGSPQYFSPEQATGLPPSPASDVYSLGVILYEMLSGRLPFNADSATELARLHREITPIAPRTFNPAIPPTLEKIILKVLSKEPATRYRTADQLGRVLLTYSRSAVQTAPPPLEAAPIPELQPLRRPPLTRSPAPPVSPVDRRAPRTAGRGSPPPLIVETGFLERGGEENPLSIDWVTWGLGLVAMLAVGGLIPLCLWVYLAYNPPMR